MRRQAIFTLLCLLLSTTFAVQAQLNIKVPNKIKFADMQLELDEDAKNAVQKKVNGLTRSPRFYAEFVNRCNIYFPLIEEAFAEENVPEDFKFLALQESALIADAVSRSNAVGFWQFKQITATELGLRIDRNVDERKNIISASHGAARYLRKNNRFMRNWVYSLLSYNLGLTGANTISDRSKIGADKMNLDKNTHIYIIHFLAHKVAFEDAVNKSSGLFKLMKYPKAGGKTIDEIAKISGIDKDEIASYNRWLKADQVPTGRDYNFILPVPMKRVKELREKMELDEEVKDLVADNGNDLKKPTDKKTGNMGKNTTKPVMVKNAAYPKITNKQKKPVGKQTITLAEVNGKNGFITGNEPQLFELLSSFKVSRKKFMAINDLKVSDEIEPNQYYYLKSKRGKAESEQYHVTQQGETLHDIAQMYGIKEKSLLKKNRMRVGEEPQAGRVMWLKKKRPKKEPIEIKEIKKTTTEPKDDEPKDKDETKEEKALDDILDIVDEDKKKNDATPDKIITNGKFHVVKKSETLYAISREYKLSILELKDLNNLGEDLSLREGQILIVRKDDPNALNNGLGGNENSLDDIIGESIKIDGNGNVVDSIFSLKDLKPTNNTTGGNTTNTGGLNTGGLNTGGSSGFTSIHTVLPGETLSSIGKTYNATPSQLREWNNLDPNDLLRISQKLVVSNPNGTGTTTNTNSGINTQPIRDVKKHIIQRGETLYSISRQYKVPVSDLIKWNKLTASSNLSVGQEVFTEDPVAYNKAIITNNLNTTANTGKPRPIYHVVRKSENLATIAYRYDVTTDHIIRKNKLRNLNVTEGQTLLIEDFENYTPTNNTNTNSSNTTVKKDEIVSVPTNTPKLHVVQKGDTMWGLSQKYRASPEQIRAWNRLPSNSLSLGQELVVGYQNMPVNEGATKASDGPNVDRANSTNQGGYLNNGGNSTNTNTTTTGPVYHTVQKGDTLYSITRKYSMSLNDVKKLNPGLTANLSLGQRIRVK